MKNNFKIRMILDPTTESFASFIGIDKFDEINPKCKEKTYYYACAQIYGENKTKIMHENKFFCCGECGFKVKFGINIQDNDIFIIPNVEEYLLLNAALKANKLIYNKKKGTLTKKGD